MSIEGRDVVVSLDVSAGAALATAVRQAMWVAPFPCSLISARPVAITAPSGASILLDLNLATLSSNAFSSETTVFTTQGNRPTIATGKNLGASTAPDVVTLAKGDVLTVDVDQTGTAPTNEVQSIAVDATGGTFTVTFEGSATPAQAFNVSAANLQAALRALPGLDSDLGDVAVTGGPGVAGGGTPYVLTFGGRHAGQDVPAVTTGVGSLTGGASTAAVTTNPAGAAGTPGSGVKLVLHLQRI